MKNKGDVKRQNNLVLVYVQRVLAVKQPVLWSGLSK